MKCIFPLLLLTHLLSAQDTATQKKEDLAAVLDTQSKSVILIDPKTRAADFAWGFDLLRKDKPSQKIMVKTASGVLLNVTDVTPSTGGSLLLIKTLSNQGVRSQIVPVEQIMEIGYSP